MRKLENEKWCHSSSNCGRFFFSEFRILFHFFHLKRLCWLSKHKFFLLFAAKLCMLVPTHVNGGWLVNTQYPSTAEHYIYLFLLWVCVCVSIQFFSSTRICYTCSLITSAPILFSSGFFLPFVSHFVHFLPYEFIYLAKQSLWNRGIGNWTNK